MKIFAQVVFFGLLALIFVSVSGQYDASYNDVEDDVDEGNREARQTPYAYVPPSRSCSRVSYGNSYCGGFSSGNQGGCDSYCLQQGYPLSYCRPTHCLCHRGQDLGRECEQQRGK